MGTLYFYLITNLTTFGVYDYKGLDIDQFLAGSQVYNDADNEFSVASTEDYQGGHVNVTMIGESDYTTYRETYLPKPVEPITEDKYKELLARQDAADLAIMALMDSVTMG
ncbi:hypothetical protein [Paenibacillus glacialis]|uniref:Uncharacterized protein n=1 Tax=Paenibacillus glacialis TaxID=494026 RepID=A0A168NRA1_9BACL|nr:hypothetical protein [Paenibacillus glacialis]OAB46052.1 hypothetical protein PGLA_01255 [Paenibacillus glacialis]